MNSPMHGREKGLFHPKLSVIFQLLLVKGVYLTYPLKEQYSSSEIDVCIKKDDHVVYFKSFDILVVTQFKP
jgi:hypothetical protein